MLTLAALRLPASQAPAPPAIWTGQYDDNRTSANLNETILTTSNVNTTHFGLLFTRPVDGMVYAQPLYVPGLTINGAVHNVVFVATMNNSVFAFDADQPSLISPLWQVNLGPPFPLQGNKYVYLGPLLGILSTPVIDTLSNTMYVVPAVYQSGARVYKLHALDITTGQEKFGGPVRIQGSVPGTAPDGKNGRVTFSAGNQLQRPALTLYRTSVKVMFGGADENLPFHGWTISYDIGTLQQQGISCVTPNGNGGGIWMSGRGAGVDGNGVYFAAGNGSAGNGLAEGVVRQSNTSMDYFIPADATALSAHDWDLGAGGLTLIPGTGLLIAGGKTGAFFVLNRSNLGGYVPGNTQVVQTWQATAGCPSQAWNGCDEIHHTALWNRGGGAAPLLYLWAWEEALQAFAFNGSTFNTTPVARNAAIANYPGGILAVSANGSTPGTGILWAAMSTQNSAAGPSPGMLRAFDAVSLTELWNSTINPADNAGLLAKFSVPTVVNGKVYLATFSNRLSVYGQRRR